MLDKIRGLRAGRHEIDLLNKVGGNKALDTVLVHAKVEAVIVYVAKANKALLLVEGQLGIVIVGAFLRVVLEQGLPITGRKNTMNT